MCIEILLSALANKKLATQRSVPASDNVVASTAPTASSNIDYNTAWVILKNPNSAKPGNGDKLNDLINNEIGLESAEDLKLVSEENIVSIQTLLKDVVGMKFLGKK